MSFFNFLGFLSPTWLIIELGISFGGIGRFVENVGGGIKRALVGGRSSSERRAVRDMERRKGEYLANAAKYNMPYPGFYSGVVGQGKDVRLDPRFAIQDATSDRAQNVYGQLLNMTGPYQQRPGIRDSALDDYARSSQSQAKTGIAESLASRGLRGVDRQALEQQRQSNLLSGGQAIRQGYGLADAAARAQWDMDRNRSLGGIANLAGDVGYARRANADRLLSELQSKSQYNNQAYRASLLNQAAREQASGIV